MPLYTMDDDGNAAKWGERAPDVIDAHSREEWSAEFSRREAALLPSPFDKPLYHWLGEKAEDIEDDGWITVHGCTTT